MKTLLFTLEYPPFHGGVANYYGNLVKYWPASPEIFVLSSNDHKLINPRLLILKWLPAIFALRQAVKENKIEHILVGQILPLGLVSLLVSKFTGVKYSVIIHGMDFTYALKHRRKKIITKAVLKNSQKIICSSSYTASLVREFLDEASKKNIIVVNPGIENLESCNQQLKNQLRDKYNLNNKQVLLSVGRLVKRKGFDKVLLALPEVLKQAPDLVYVILGNGEELSNFQSLIRQNKLENNVIIINNADDEERGAWYNLSDIFIMSSREIKGDFEGFGIVYLEANLAGKPVIGGKSGGVADAVRDGLNGLMVNPEDINEISAAIIKLALDHDLRHKLGEQGRQRAISEFNWEKQIDKIYKSLI